MDYLTFKELYGNYISLTTFLCILTLILYYKPNSKLKLPPGPRGIPFLGYLPFLDKKPYKTFQKLSKKYGGVFSIQMGNQINIVLNSFAAVQEAFVKEAFQGRPPMMLRVVDRYSNFADMDGQIWIDHNKFIKTAMKGVGMSDSVARIKMQGELDKVLSELQNSNIHEDINIRELMSTAFHNVLLALTCSNTVDGSDQIAKTLQHYEYLIPRHFAETFLKSSLPSWLKSFLLTETKNTEEYKTTVQDVENYFKSEIQRHQKNFDDAHPIDFIDYYLIEILKRTTSFDELTLNGMLQIFLLGGSEKTRVSLEWSLLYLAKYPDLQEKVYQAIVKEFGTEKDITWNERNDMPYVWAFLFEVQRRKTILPFGVSRRVTEDTTLQGFDIPKNTTIMLNLWGIHMDENYFKNPEIFDPERFLADNGKRLVIPESYMPFSIGTRKCPGSKMAKINLFLFFVSLVQKYKILPPKEGVNLESELRTVTLALHPFVKFVPR